ncbi:MAG TPA: hypothetical protein VN554_00445 [Verrucomicrobiae bacterium]|nr:hypothetical protein [Verrucomicrobiae bacterium]
MMKRPTSIIVVGSSGNGKTTLVNGLRAYEDTFIFPKRYITRPQRKGDDLIENEHVDPARFDELLDAGHLAVAWTRPLGKTRRERYGFETIQPEESRMVVYSANNALLRDETAVVPANLFGDSFIVLVKAPDRVRQERVFGRSPDLRQEEMDIRLQDNGLDLVPRVDMVIDTHAFNPQRAVDLVRKAVSA